MDLAEIEYRPTKDGWEVLFPSFRNMPVGNIVWNAARDQYAFLPAWQYVFHPMFTASELVAIASVIAELSEQKEEPDERSEAGPQD